MCGQVEDQATSSRDFLEPLQQLGSIPGSWTEKYLSRAEVGLAEPLSVGKGTGQRVSGDSPSLWIEVTTF